MPARGRSLAAVCLSFWCGACTATGPSDRREPLEQDSRRAEVQRLIAEIARDPDNPSRLRSLANQRWALGELDAAQEAFERALALAPDDDDARLELVSLLYGRGRYVEARSLIQSLRRPPSAEWVGRVRDQFDQLMKGSAGAVGAAELRRVGAELVNSVDMSFVEVPGGSFVRGEEDGAPDQRPARRIAVAPFRIGKYEVTQGQFRRFLDETHYPFEQYRVEPFAPDAYDAPALGISWEDARAFTIWLSGRERAGYRLPTEAEWELAARGMQGNREPWGHERGKAGLDGNWGRTALKDYRARVPPVRRVGSFARDRSPFGVFDMAGNVREWCLDEYDDSYYAWSPAANPFGPVEARGIKVLRGGSWNDARGAGLVVVRSHAPQNQGYTGYGFRVVREIAP